MALTGKAIFSVLITKRKKHLLDGAESSRHIFRKGKKITTLSQDSCYIPGQMGKHDF